MANKIMLLIDSTKIRSEAVRYSAELAKRTESELFLLMILSLDHGGGTSKDNELQEGLEERIREELLKHMETVSEEGVSVKAAVRMGDGRSELMKFLAGASPFQTIVWGGEEELTRGKTKRQNTHWLVNMKDMLKCPLVVPSLKS